MRTATETRWAVLSAGRVLTVAATTELTAAWPQIAPHVPGVLPGEPLRTGEGPAVAAVPDNTRDARRLINAHLHVLHLAGGTVCVHAVALYRPGVGAVLLLGGHGAGKTLVGIKLAMYGWQWLAGDVVLLDIAEQIAVRGGTSALLARRVPVLRWFPALGVAEPGPRLVDLHREIGLSAVTVPGGVPVAAAVLVDVDGDPAAAGGVVEQTDRHTAATVWLRASGHLLDRILDGGKQILRSLEDGPALAQRVDYVHMLADRLRLHAVRGAPDGIAARIEQLAAHHRQART